MTQSSNAFDEKNSSVISKNISRLMSEKNVSEVQLARSLNVSVMTIRRVISGETEDPRLSTLSLIAEYFNVGLDALLETRTMPISILNKNKPYFVPIIDWHTLEKSEGKNIIDAQNWQKWYPLMNNDGLKLDEQSFALESKPSMQPRYPMGTLFIINNKIKPDDSDIILIKTRKNRIFSLRELTIDAPRWILQPLVDGSEILYFDESECDIIGTVVLTVFQPRM